MTRARTDALARDTHIPRIVYRSKYLVFLLILAFVVIPLAATTVGNRTLAVLLPTPLGITYPALLIGAASLGSLVAGFEAWDTHASWVSRMFSLVGLLVGALIVILLATFGEPLARHHRHLTSEDELDAARSLIHYVSLSFVGMAICSSISSTSAWWRRRNDKLRAMRLFALDLPLLFSTVALASLSARSNALGGEYLIEPVINRLEVIGHGALRGTELDDRLRIGFMIMARDAFVLGMELGAVVIHFVMAKFAAFFLVADDYD